MLIYEVAVMQNQSVEKTKKTCTETKKLIYEVA